MAKVPMTFAQTIKTGFGGALLALSVPALADVKAGVDAWTQGDYAAAVAEWREPAAKGDPDAQFNLGQAYRLGRGVEIDARQAEALYAKAAEQGHLRAADIYGLLLFQDGRRAAAMPYLTAAADRGDPRAQYLIGIAHFNGDLLAKDWVRAYALLTLSNSAGLPQALAAIRQMDEHIPRDQREQAQSLAQQLKGESDARRTVQMAKADLTVDGETAETAPPRSTAKTAAPSIGAGKAALAQAAQPAGNRSPAQAGADFVPSTRASSPPPVRPDRVEQQVTQVTAPAPRALPAEPKSGPWKVQLGAFSVAGNADKLWRQLSGRSELAGASKLLVPEGRLTKLLAGGYPSRAAADTACASLKKSGQSCLVTR